MALATSTVDILLFDRMISHFLFRKARNMVAIPAALINGVIVASLTALCVLTPNIRLLLFIVMISLYAMLCFERNIAVVVPIIVMYVLMIQVGDIFAMGLSMLVFQPEQKELLFEGETLYFGMVAFYLFAAIAIVVVRRVARQTREFSYKDVLSLIIIPFVSAVLAIILDNLSLLENPPAAYHLLMSAFFFAMLVVSVLHYNILSKAVTDRMAAIINERQIAQYAGQQELFMKTYNELRRYRHDMRHHLGYIASLARNDENSDILQYISALSTDSDIPVKEAPVYGNLLIDSIIEMYKTICSERSISSEFQVTVPQTMHVEYADVCSLLSNVLENAVEASMQISEKENRRLRVRIYIHSVYLFVEVVNTYKALPVRESADWLTSKEQKERVFDESYCEYHCELAVSTRKHG